MYSVSESVFHKLVKYLRPISDYQNGGKYLKQHITDKDRIELESKMATIFGENIKGLSTELQEILLDDMVTAFENRLKVLNVASAKGSC